MEGQEKEAATTPLVVHRADGKKQLVLSRRNVKSAKLVRSVVEEEEYLTGVETIVERDFFPDLKKLKAQAEYLEAVEQNDLGRIRALQFRYATTTGDAHRRATSPTAPPAAHAQHDRNPERVAAKATDETTTRDDDEHEHNLEEEEEEEAGKEEGLLHRPKVETDNVGLDTFLSTYTSEDNASFEEMMEMAKKRERVQNSWMYDAEKKHKVNEGPAALPAQDEQISAIEWRRPKQPDNWTYVARNQVLFISRDEAPLTMEERVARQKQQEEKRISTRATRYEQNPFSEIQKRQTMAKAAIHLAVGNKGHVDVSGNVSSGQAFGQPAAFSTLATPSPAPGIAESPLMTWGEIEGTPFRLDAGDVLVPDTGPVFKIPEIPLRDKLAQGIGSTIGKRYREKRKLAIREAAKKHEGTPKFGSRRSSDLLSSMSPAARRLATHKLGIRLGTDKELKASYTPSPLRRASSSSAGTPTLKSPRPPAQRQTLPSASSTQPNSSLTDNLLQLNSAKTSTRPSAADFF